MRLFWVFVIGASVISGCSEPTPSARTPVVDSDIMYSDVSRKDEPIVISIQHVLIGFKGAGRSKPGVERSQQEAEDLAKEVLAKAKAGEDFGALVKKFSDDGGDDSTGIYKMVNFGGHGIENPAAPKMNVYPRKKMAKAFGDIGFKLKVGEFGMTQYSPQDSPFGFHVIKRIK